MHRVALFAFTLLALLPLPAAPLPPVVLWPQGAPGALGTLPKDIPTLTIYPPDPGKATGASFVICPGGGYGALAPHEGEGYALWFAAHGVTGIVLKYRLASSGYHHPAMIEDAARALRTVRANAAAWNLDPHRIGIIGSSAGGHLASTLLTHYDSGKPDDADPIERQSSRPDLGVLCYAVITMGPDTHSGTHDNLIGKNPAPELVDELSNEKHVTADTPPCFIWHNFEDKTVKVVNALDFASALLAHKVPFELHIYEKGGHGIGMGQAPPRGQYYIWTNDLESWLRQRGWLTPQPQPAPATPSAPATNTATP
jgi:acetyl esterase/lipase